MFFESSFPMLEIHKTCILRQARSEILLNVNCNTTSSGVIRVFRVFRHKLPIVVSRVPIQKDFCGLHKDDLPYPAQPANGHATMPH